MNITPVEQQKLIEKYKGKSLADLYPDIAKEWDYQKNDSLTPQMVTYGSKKKVWWKCQNVHSYESSIVSRTNNGSGCPYCSGRLPIQGKTDLATIYPNIAKEWDYKKNYPLTPQQVTKSSGKKVWWLCPKGHHYESSIAMRTSQNLGCPYCSGRLLILGKTDLATLYPNLATEWDYEKNSPLTPYMVTKGSGKKVWWLCPKGHHYERSIAMRTSQNLGCPYCSGKKILQGFNDLATTHPDIAKEWNYEKNGTLTPQMVSKGSNKKVWWECSKGHSYKSQIANRTNGTSCPYCSGQKIQIGFNDLATTHPNLAAEWDYEKNDTLTPQMITKCSGKKIWWLCSKGHSYASIVIERNKGKGCPYCSGQKVLQNFNDIATTNPNIAKEWDYEKNYPLTPQMVTKGSNKKVWWKCSHGHSYLQVISNKTALNQGCPICAMSKGERFLYDLLTKHNIAFSSEYKFAKINEVRFYPFDFYLYDYRLIIEYDGEQHFSDVFSYENKKSNFKTTVKHDNIKNEFCLKYNFPILRIPYIYNPETDSDKIINLVATFVKTKRIPQEIIDFYSQYDFSNYAGIASQLNNKSL